MAYRNHVVRGSVDDSFSTLPSSELSTQGLLFNSCGSVGNGGQKTVKVLEKRGSLTKTDFVRNGLKNASQTLPQNHKMYLDLHIYPPCLFSRNRISFC